MAKSTIFVTGATGVIGRRVVPILVSEGHRVTGVARSAEAERRLAEAGANPITVDLFDSEAVERAIAGHEVIINLATHIPPSSRAFVPGAWRATNRIRRELSAILATAGLKRGVSRLIQESFAPIYQDAGDAWITETSPVKAARYNSGVLDAEAAVERFTQSGGTGVALRFSYFYGPDSDFTLYTIRAVRRGRAPVLGSPMAFMSSVSHDDAAAAVAAALTVPAGCYNVTDDRPVTRREYVDSLAAALGVAPPKFFPTWVAALAGSLGETLARSQRISNAKLAAASGWTPRLPSVVEGWREVVAATQRDASAAPTRVNLSGLRTR